MTLVAAKRMAMAVGGRGSFAVGESFIECKRQLLAGEGPIGTPETDDGRTIPTGTDTGRDHTPEAATPPGRRYRPSTPEGAIPLTMEEFGATTRIRLPAAWLAAEEKSLMERLFSDGREALVGQHPADRRLVFHPSALDEWWRGAFGRRPVPNDGWDDEPAPLVPRSPVQH